MPSTRLLAACAALLAVAGAHAAAPQPSSQDDARRLAVENELLAKRADLASGKDFYLILDPSAARLTLFLRGAALRRYDVLGLEIAEPQVAFVARGAAHPWQNRIWAAGTLSPDRAEDRIEIKIPPPGAEPAAQVVPIPPTPEEAHPVPARYGIGYDGGLFVEVRAQGDDAEDSTMGTRLGVWWEDFKAVLWPEPTNLIRLRLTLRAEDAQAIYRSLPPDTKLLILPPR